jgi:hypothetical protein
MPTLQPPRRIALAASVAVLAASAVYVCLRPAHGRAGDRPLARPEVATAPAIPAPRESAPPAPPPREPVAGRAEPQVSAAALPMLDVSTTPSGAVVFVDGHASGETPLHLPSEAGAHSLRIVREGYKLRRESAAVSGAHTQLNFLLEPALLPDELSGSVGVKVRCRSLGELRILVDGHDTGRQCPNEQRIALKPGSHKIGLYDPRTDQTYETERELADDSPNSTRIYIKR